MTEVLVALRRAQTLASWTADGGKIVPGPAGVVVDGHLVVAEDEEISFRLEFTDADRQYRILVGDLPIDEMFGHESKPESFDDLVRWPRKPYLESAAGRTRIRVEWSPSDGPYRWQPCIDATVFVNPTKAGRDNHLRLVEDLGRLSRSLISDILGKSTRRYELRAARDGRRSRPLLEELELLRRMTTECRSLVEEISRRPASRMALRQVVRRINSSSRIRPRDMVAMDRRGATPRSPDASIVTSRPYESFDVSEHRLMVGLVERLSTRARECRLAAERYQAGLLADQRLRDVRVGDHSSSSLFESEDLPRINGLNEAIRQARTMESTLARLRRSTVLRTSAPRHEQPTQGQFLQNAGYRRMLGLIKRQLVTSVLENPGSEFEITSKLTSKLFEQWCFLKVVDGFRRAGLEFEDWDHALRSEGRTSLIVDFRRGLSFSARLSDSLRIRVRYEPWIMGLEDAISCGETLCRGQSGSTAWSPDIVVEFLVRNKTEWVADYAVVLDAKYRRDVGEVQWTRIGKYSGIRSVGTKLQVAKHLWILHIGDRNRIASANDDLLAFTDHGPTSSPDENVQFVLQAAPAARDDEADPFQVFALGTLRYLQRHRVRTRLSIGDRAEDPPA